MGGGSDDDAHSGAAAQPVGSTPAPDPIEASSKACFASPAGQTTSGMTECSRQAYVAYDRELNAVYQSVLKHVDPASAALIRDAQRQWVALQAADQAADNGPWRNDRGSMTTPDIEALRIDAIRQRIAKLRYYDPG